MFRCVTSPLSPFLFGWWGASVQKRNMRHLRGDLAEESSKKGLEKIRIQPTLGNVTFSIWSQNDRRSLLSGAS